MCGADLRRRARVSGAPLLLALVGAAAACDGWRSCSGAEDGTAKEGAQPELETPLRPRDLQQQALALAEDRLAVVAIARPPIALRAQILRLAERDDGAFLTLAAASDGEEQAWVGGVSLRLALTAIDATRFGAAPAGSECELRYANEGVLSAASYTVAAATGGYLSASGAVRESRGERAVWLAVTCRKRVQRTIDGRPYAAPLPEEVRLLLRGKATIARKR